MGTDGQVVDVNGVPLRRGDAVRVRSIPGWLIHDLPPDEQLDILRCVGQTLVVQDIDSYRYAWLGTGTYEEVGEDATYAGHSFAMPGECLEKL
jgi:hypothetical protein